MDELEKDQRLLLLKHSAVVSVYDPEIDGTKQVTLDVAKRMAPLRSDVAAILDGMEIDWRTE